MTDILRLAVATANPDKHAEIERILREAILIPFELLERPTEIPEVEEDGETLYENAHLKAEAIGAATGLVAVADDTGLFVNALGGAPGVRSARYAGDDASYAMNVTKLLDALGDEDDRRASFRTVAVAVFPDGRELSTAGELLGVISRTPRGDGGFGYDSVFLPDEDLSRSLAELTPSEKNAISHRGRAFRALAASISRSFASEVGS